MGPGPRNRAWLMIIRVCLLCALWSQAEAKKAHNNAQSSKISSANVEKFAGPTTEVATLSEKDFQAACSGLQDCIECAWPKPANSSHEDVTGLHSALHCTLCDNKKVICNFSLLILRYAGVIGIVFGSLSLNFESSMAQIASEKKMNA